MQIPPATAFPGYPGGTARDYPYYGAQVKRHRTSSIDYGRPGIYDAPRPMEAYGGQPTAMYGQPGPYQTPAAMQPYPTGQVMPDYSVRLPSSFSLSLELARSN